MSAEPGPSTGLLFAAALALAGSPAPATAEVTIGLATPLSGPLAASGARNLLAVMAAIEHLNAAGGVLGEPVELISVDDKCGTSEAIAAAEELVRAEVALVVGHMCSHSSVLAAAMYDVADIVMITPDSTHPRLTEEGRPNVFRLIGRDDMQAAAAATLIEKRWPDARIAIVHDTDVYGEGLARETERALRRRDIAITLVEPYTPGNETYPDLVDKLATAEIDLLYISGYGPDAGRIIADARRAGLDLQLVGGDGLALPEFWATAGKAGTGTIVSSFTIRNTSTEPATTPERERARAEFEAGGLGAYAAVELWARAADRVKTLDPEPVTRALHQHQFDTIHGPVTFDQKGDLQNATWTWQTWQDGKKQPLE